MEVSSDVSDDKSNETSVDVSHERIRYETAAKRAPGNEQEADLGKHRKIIFDNFVCQF